MQKSTCLPAHQSVAVDERHRDENHVKIEHEEEDGSLQKASGWTCRCEHASEFEKEDAVCYDGVLKVTSFVFVIHWS